MAYLHDALTGDGRPSTASAMPSFHKDSGEEDDKGSHEKALVPLWKAIKSTRPGDRSKAAQMVNGVPMATLEQVYLTMKLKPIGSR